MRRFNHSSNAASSYRPRMASLTAADTSWSIQMLIEEPANERTPEMSGAWLAVNADTMDLDALLEDDLSEDGAEVALSDDEIELCEDDARTPEAAADCGESVIELTEDSLVEDDAPAIVIEPPRRAPKPRKPRSWRTSKSAARASSETNEARLAQTVVAAGKLRLAAPVLDEEAIEELGDDELVDAIEGTISLNDGDVEVVESETGGRMEQAENGTLLYYCRPGDSLPPALVPTSELPRFAVPKARLPQLPERLPQFSIIDGEAAVAAPRRMQAVRLPQFSIPPEPVRRPRVPAVRLPRFPIEEMAPSRPRPPAPRRFPAQLPSFGQWTHPQLASAAQSWPLYQAAASGSWPAHQSSEFPACPHCREQLLLAAAWSAAPALFGCGAAHR